MIKELSDLGKTLRNQKTENQWVHDALKEETISIEIVINEDGSFIKFEQFEKKLTIAESIPAKKGKARLLLDKAEEVLCYGGEVSKKKHTLFLEKLKTYENLQEMAPILAFYLENGANGVEKALSEFETAIPEEKNRKGNIGFRIYLEGFRVHEKPEILRKIIEKYDYSQREFLKIEQRNCSICGTHEYPVEDIPHGMIKRVPKGQSSGCALVSYNENAFESYKLKGNNNSSICTNCAKTYVEGLNWLLSTGNETSVVNKAGKEKAAFRYTNRKNLGPDTAMVFWTRKNEKLPEIDQLEAPNAEDVAELLESVTSGNANDSRYLEPDWFYATTLSGSAARISVRDWIETSLLDFRVSIAKWFQDICIAEYDINSCQFKLYYPGIYALSKSCQDEAESKDVTFPRVATFLWDAAIKNTSLPLWILTKVLKRARLDEYGVTAERAALIKIVLNRSSKGGDFVIKDKLQEGDRPVAYICGQIFAKLESIQYAALGQINAGIRERYFTYSMTMPSAAFGRLFNLNSKHFTKLKNDKPGLAVMLDKELQELCKDIEISKFPTTFQLEEQGQFAIGYYHQKQSQFNALKNKEEK